MSSFDQYFESNAAGSKKWIWEHTIYQVTRLFEEAEKRVISHEGQIEHCIDGWWRKRQSRINGKNGYLVPEETAISEALVREMENARQEFVVNRHLLDDDLADIDSLQFYAEAPRRQRKGIGRKAKPTDFRFYRSGLGEIDLRIEAKVLTKDSEIPSAYVASAGMGRFSDPLEPYTDDLVGGMIAYTVADDRAAWTTKLTHHLSVASPAVPTFMHTISPSPQAILYSRVPFNFTGGKVARREILVFHIVLELDSLPSAR